MTVVMVGVVVMVVMVVLVLLLVGVSGWVGGVIDDRMMV
jgi:hypothetical protein